MFKDLWGASSNLSILNEKIVSLPAYIDTFISLTLGLVAAVLTLVGLLAIYISINSQHNIEKGRELLWDLKGEKKLENIIKQVVLYSDIVRGNHKYTTKVIRRTTLTILVVILISIMINLFLIPYFPKNLMYFTMGTTAIICLLFISFIILLVNLKNISKVSDLPTPKQLFNADKPKHGIDALSLFAYSLETEIVKINDSWYLILSTPFNFEGIAIIMVWDTGAYNISELPTNRYNSPTLNANVNNYLIKLSRDPSTGSFRKEGILISIRSFKEYEPQIKEYRKMVELNKENQESNETINLNREPWKSISDKKSELISENGRFIDILIQGDFDDGISKSAFTSEWKTISSVEYKSKTTIFTDNCSSLYEFIDE
ncbi:MAG: hypothetical protein WAM95_19195 [Bacillus sp. (in: firmicutes)]